MSHETKPPAEPPATRKPAGKEDRLAARLRENLKKRKEQARAREQAGEAKD